METGKVVKVVSEGLAIGGSEFLADIAATYDQNPFIKAAFKLVPGGSAVETILSTNLNTVKKERLKVFFNELASGKQILTPDIIENNEFLFCWDITYQAVLKTYREEKIRFFGRLLKNCFEEKGAVYRDVEDYENYISILSELNFNEIELLVKVSDLEKEYHDISNNPLEVTNAYWSNLLDYVSERFKWSEDDLHSYLLRLQRTACYKLFTNYMGPTLGKGHTTHLFQKLKSAARLVG